MITKLFRERAIRNPVAFVGRVLYKLTLERVKYGRGNDYAAESYWTDRFNKFGTSLKGPGYDGLSEKANLEMYEDAGERFAEFCAQQGINFDSKRVLEIGCGTGFYTDRISKMAPKIDYTGIDITDALFPTIQSRHPSFKFIKTDVSQPRHDIGPFDIIVMIDVIEHIVTLEKLQAAMANIKSWLAPGGVFVVGPLVRDQRNRKEFYYVHWWTIQPLEQAFDGYRFSEKVPFRTQHIVAISAPDA